MHYNEDIARSEGWHVVRYSDRDIRICAFGGDSDYDAWAHVVKRAREGSKLHLDALNMIDPNEQLDIIAACGWYKTPWMQETA
jgi:hypothetical protein